MEQLEHDCQGFNPPGLSEEEKFEEFPVITANSDANEIIESILMNEEAVIGIDTEAAVEMSRFGILCLIQVNQK